MASPSARAKPMRGGLAGEVALPEASVVMAQPSFPSFDWTSARRLFRWYRPRAMVPTPAATHGTLAFHSCPERPCGKSRTIPRVLSIAGSDSGGGAGIQADLKAFVACGVHGMTAVTAITAQNTVGVTAVHPVPGETIIAQVRAVAEDIGIDAVKIGMLGDAPTIEAVAAALDDLAPGTPVVVDPVMVAESGAVLLASS